MIFLLYTLIICITDIIISAFSLNIISQNKVKINILELSLLIILSVIIRCYFNLGYFINGIIIYILLILVNQKKLEYKYILVNTFIYISIHLLIMPIVNILIFFIFHGFLSTDIELSLFDASGNIEFTYKMIFLLGLIDISVQRLEYVNIEKRYWRYFYIFIILSLMTLVITLGFSNEASNSINLTIYSFLSGITLISTFLLYYFFQSLMTAVKENNDVKLMNQKNDMKFQKILDDNKQNEEFKKYKHDFKNNLLILQYLIQENQFKEVHKYINEYVDQYSKNSSEIDIENIIVGAVINNKIRSYPNIRFRTTCFLPKTITISDLDMVTILGNIIDNACEYLVRENIDGEININIYQYYDNVFIEVQNDCLSMDVSDIRTLKTSKHNKDEHGYGLQNVRKVVEKYDGTLECKVSDGKFYLRILLYSPEEVNDNENN